MTDKKVVPYQEMEASKKEQIEMMFDNVAPRYDLLNRIISLGIDKHWRRKAIDILAPLEPQRILDVATGTGDFALATLSLEPKEIVGVDISTQMLAVAREKINKKKVGDIVKLKVGDAENLPFEDNSFDAITVAFGVRNFENLDKGLKELNRVLRKDGKLVVLELTRPGKFPMKQLYDFYAMRILPLIGRLISKDQNAYSYLPESIRAFPEGQAFIQHLEQCSFQATEWMPLTFGACSIYTGTK